MKIRSAVRIVSLTVTCVVAMLGQTSPAPAKSSGAAGSGLHQTMAEKAGDPMAPIIQLQLQDTIIPSTIGAEGWANQFQFQPVIPIPARHGLKPQLIRLTMDVVTMPGPNRKTALGDISFFDQFALKRSKALVLGLGPGFVFPTATDSRLGQGKWQVGPALGLMSSSVKNWQLGAVVQNMVSVAGDRNRPGVNVLSIQPLVNYVRGEWYLGAGDSAWDFDWKGGGALTIPLGFRLAPCGRSANTTTTSRWSRWPGQSTAARPRGGVFVSASY